MDPQEVENDAARVGEKLGSGMTVDDIATSTRQVAEGVKSCESIYQLADRTGVEMPIVEHVARLIRGEVSVQEMLISLISREPKPERA